MALASLLAVSMLGSRALAAGYETGASDAADEGGTFDETVTSNSSELGGGLSGGLTVEGLILRRKGLENVPFTEAGDAPTPPTTPSSFVKFESSDLEGDEYSAGVRVSLVGSVLDQPIELSAFFVGPFSFEQQKLNMTFGPTGARFNTDTVYANLPGQDVGNLLNSDAIYGLHIHHESHLFGAEANALGLFGIPGLSVGVRGIDFGEMLSSTTMDTSASVPGLGTESVRDHVGIETDNRLLGVQVGLQHMFEVGDSLRVGGSIKGGLYNNFVDRSRTFVSENALHQRAFESNDHKNVFSQAVEFNPRIEWRLAENFYLTAAGQFLWLNNVSTALPHYATVTSMQGDRDVRATDDMYFYGGSLGLTVLFDESSPISNSLPAFSSVPSTLSSHASLTELDERVAELEEATARKGNENISLSISGWINRMVMFWDDGAESDVYIVDNVSSRSRVNFEGAAKIARGWSAGYLLSLGLDDQASNDVDQLTSNGEGKIDMRHSAWWLRSSELGTVTTGYTSTATDNIILKDTGGIMPGASNIATIGGSFMLRRADWYEQGDGALVRSASGTVNTTLNDISAGASVDTLRRNIIRYDAPRFSGQWGNVDLSVAWGDDDFFDTAIEHGINYNDWRFRFGAGYLHDTTEGRPGGRRDRQEYKGSASLLHIPTGLFGTVAYVHRSFHGLERFDDPGTPGAVYGENTAGHVTPPGTNRPPLDYFYSAFGLRRQYWSLGDTSIYGEYAQVDDAITGLHEAGMDEVTDSTLQMFGFAISQDIDAAGMDLYAGFRFYTFDTEGAQRQNATTYPIAPAPLTDLMFGYAGSRIRF
jgi:hypothetical protein